MFDFSVEKYVLPYKTGSADHRVGQFWRTFFISASSSFYRLIASFGFIAVLIPTRSILDLTLPVTELLPGKEIDMVDASDLFDSLRVSLPKRSTFNEFQHKCYRIILEIAKMVIMKLNLVMLHFVKNPLVSVSDYSWKVVTIPLLDHLLAQLTLLGTGFQYSRRVGINHAQYFLKYSTMSFENLFSCNSTYSELIDWRKNLMTSLFLMTSSFLRQGLKRLIDYKDKFNWNESINFLFPPWD